MIEKKPALKEIETNIKAVVVNGMEISADRAGKITSETNFASDLEVESLEFVSLVMRIEKEFGVEIADEDFGQIATVGAMATYIQARME